MKQQDTFGKDSYGKKDTNIGNNTQGGKKDFDKDFNKDRTNTTQKKPFQGGEGGKTGKM